MEIAITGSTGAFGTLAIKHLQNQKRDDVSIIALARDTAKASVFQDQGIEVRQADYDSPETLESALAGIDRLLLVSGSEFGKRVRQHENVINAAVRAGVNLLVYTSITNAEASGNPLAPEHKATEAIIKGSGIPYVILRNNWYTENYAEMIKRAKSSGVIMAAAGSGKVASVTRSELAEAAAIALTSDTDDQTRKTYELSGDIWDYEDLAAAISNIIDRDVTYKPVSGAELKAVMLGMGMPEHIVNFLVSLDEGIAEGTLDFISSDLESLLGRKPKGLQEGLSELTDS